ncbi:hypothetical protein Z947_2193 [Sulfitobacter geojensis]|nr:hypothetical protein Z947_2193 [Sulfitobacter geojensis]
MVSQSYHSLSFGILHQLEGLFTCFKVRSPAGCKEFGKQPLALKADVLEIQP